MLSLTLKSCQQARLSSRLIKHKISRGKRSLHVSKHLKDDIYAFGDNSDSLCGVYQKGNILSPQQVAEFPPNISIEAGTCNWRSSIILSTDRRVWSWGLNNFGQLGHPTNMKDTVKFPAEVIVLSKASTRQISAGRAHSICLINEPPQVVTIGFADVGQLGNGQVQEKPFQWPQLLSSLDHAQVKQVESGLDHCMVLGANGSVFTWGLDGFGQLGLNLGSGEVVSKPTIIDNLPPITKIFSGSDHCGAIDHEGYLWMWGSNLHGQLSVAEGSKLLLVPTKTNWNPNLQIRDIRGGGHHTILLTDSGEVWVAGGNEEGALGIGEMEKTDFFEFTKIPFFADQKIRIKSIAAGFTHNIAISEDDRVFVWGYNEDGQLGLGDSKNRFEPTENTFFAEKKPKGAACGPSHSLVWTEYSLL